MGLERRRRQRRDLHVEGTGRRVLDLRSGHSRQCVNGHCRRDATHGRRFGWWFWWRFGPLSRHSKRRQSLPGQAEGGLERRRFSTCDEGRVARESRRGSPVPPRSGRRRSKVARSLRAASPLASSRHQKSGKGKRMLGSVSFKSEREELHEEVHDDARLAGLSESSAGRCGWPRTPPASCRTCRSRTRSSSCICLLRARLTEGGAGGAAVARALSQRGHAELAGRREGDRKTRRDLRHIPQVRRTLAESAVSLDAVLIPGAMSF